MNPMCGLHRFVEHYYKKYGNCFMFVQSAIPFIHGSIRSPGCLFPGENGPIAFWILKYGECDCVFHEIFVFLNAEVSPIVFTVRLLELNINTSLIWMEYSTYRTPPLPYSSLTAETRSEAAPSPVILYLCDGWLVSVSRARHSPDCGSQTNALLRTAAIIKQFKKSLMGWNIRPTVPHPLPYPYYRINTTVIAGPADVCRLAAADRRPSDRGDRPDAQCTVFL